MRIIFHNRSTKKEIPSHYQQLSLEEVFSKSDFLSINCPLTNENAAFVNCFITPHIAWATFEASTRLMQIAVDNLKGFMEGKPVNVVN